MSIGQLLRPIRVGLKSKWFVCLVTITAAYSYYLIPNPYLKLISVLALLAATEAMIFFWGNFFFGNFFESLAQRRSISWDDTPLSVTLRSLASKRGTRLHSRRPWVLRKTPSPLMQFH